jgi:hypothetical protein
VSAPSCHLSAPRSTVHHPTGPGPPCVDPVRRINRWKIIRYSDYLEILLGGDLTYRWNNYRWKSLTWEVI